MRIITPCSPPRHAVAMHNTSASKRWDSQAASKPPQAAAAAGLVNLETSDTRVPLVIPASQLREFNHHRRCSRMARSLIACADIQQREFQRRMARYKVAFITLTYRPGCDWKPRHISEAIKNLRQWCARRSWRLVFEWKAELTRRGVVHYHLLCWLPKGLTPPMFDRCGWWPHGLTQSVWARNAVGYIAKYVSKLQQETFPKGMRMHGRGGLDSECRRQLRYRLLPTYAREVFGEHADVIRQKGGGWVDKTTGEWIPAIPLVIDWSA